MKHKLINISISLIIKLNKNNINFHHQIDEKKNETGQFANTLNLWNYGKMETHVPAGSITEDMLQMEQYI